MNSAVIVKKSNRKTVSLSITKELKVLIRAPHKMADADVEKFLIHHGKWIEKHLILQREQNEKAGGLIFTNEKILELKTKAKEIIADRVRHFAGEMGVHPAGVKITSAATRWGSCSGVNRLCFSCRIALLPIYLIDYIVVHELSHIRIKNHSRKFYLEVEKHMPDYKGRIAELKDAQKKMGI